MKVPVTAVGSMSEMVQAQSADEKPDWGER